MLAVQRQLPKRKGQKLSSPAGAFSPIRPIEEVLARLSKENTYANLRLAAFLAIRTVPILRSKCAWSIRRSSIKTETDLRGWKLLVFEYHGNAAAQLNLDVESNYIEFLSEEFADRCPARLVLRLKEVIDNAQVNHDSLWTYLKDFNKTLASNSLGPLVKKLL